MQNFNSFCFLFFSSPQTEPEARYNKVWDDRERRTHGNASGKK